MKILLATNNKGKIKEIKEILNEYEIVSLKDINLDIDVLEDGETYYDNAYKKAKEIFKITNIPTIADDSGLCIKSLNNFPGVLTHRWMDGTDNDRNNGLIKKVKGKNRECSFICCLVFYDGKKTISVEESLKGKISDTPRGDNGFGFDPIFELENGKTLAELSNNEKNKISARKKSIESLKEKLGEYNENKNNKRI